MKLLDYIMVEMLLDAWERRCSLLFFLCVFFFRRNHENFERGARRHSLLILRKKFFFVKYDLQLLVFEDY